jgi:hypothetical protein
MILKDVKLASEVVAKCVVPIRSTYNHLTGVLERVEYGLYLTPEAVANGAQPCEPPSTVTFTAEQIAEVLPGASLALTAPVEALLQSLPQFAPDPPADPEA